MEISATNQKEVAGPDATVSGAAGTGTDERRTRMDEEAR